MHGKHRKKKPNHEHTNHTKEDPDPLNPFKSVAKERESNSFPEKGKPPLTISRRFL